MPKRLLLALTALPLLLAGCGDAPDTTAADDPPADPTCEYVDGGEPARDVDKPAAEPTETGEVEVTIRTSRGDLPATLDAASAPCTVNSFLSLADQGYYDDTPCPRIADSPTFGILQCGDPTGTGAGGPGYTFDDELSGDETYPAGTLAMANRGPGTASNGSQFFVVFKDTQLAPDYTVFGTIDPAGVKVVAELAAAGNDGSNPAGGGTPNEPIDIEAVER